MSKISEHILEIYNQAAENEKQPIDDVVVDDAITIINEMNMTNVDSLFVALAALNLLKAAIKNEEYKSELSYGFINAKLSSLADIVLGNRDRYSETNVYYDQSQKCIYFEVFDVIFSYHQVKETNLIINVAAKNEPIIWTGIRLQRIAQKVFLYAKETYRTTSSELKENNDMEIAAPLMNNNNLIHCPDCNHLISHSAIVCPNCGSTLCELDNLFDGIKIGYTIAITYNNTKSEGNLVFLNERQVNLSTHEDRLIKVRRHSIDSVELLDTNEVSFIRQAQSFIGYISSLSAFDKEKIIPTNSTITTSDKAEFTVITDSGDTIICKTIGAVGYKKKFCVAGKRVYCSNISPNKICYHSIVEMSYGELLTFFENALSSKNVKRYKQRINTVVAFLHNEMANNPEASKEIKKFKKNIKTFFNQLAEESDNLSDIEGNGVTDERHAAETLEDSSSPVNNDPIYKTETERRLESGAGPQVTILGKIDLASIPDRKRNAQKDVHNIENILSEADIDKPMIVSSEKTKSFLSKKMTSLSEDRCKLLEKELDTLIRNGQKEECLQRSYQIINTCRPTPKYLKSYLDRIVNTEIALDHTTEALQALAYLIAFSEKQKDCNPNSLCHSYITMARLYQKEGNLQEALKAIKYAEILNADNKTIVKLKETISNMESTKADESTPTTIGLPVDNKDSISEMLLQDVLEEAHRQELLPSTDIVSADILLGEAQRNRDNKDKTYEDKAKSFLQAAGSFYNNGQTNTFMYKTSIANYARLKGQGMFERFANALRNNDIDVHKLHAFQDSACSYYVEALSIFNTLGDKIHLQELLLRYLQLHFVLSQLNGGKTPDADWEKSTLKQLQQDCLSNDSTENFRILLSAYITVGAAAEGAWGTLESDADGTGVFTDKCKRMDFRSKAFSLFNEIEHSNITNNSSVSFNSFIHQIFEHRNNRINELKRILDHCLSWSFSPFDVSSFDSLWNNVGEYKEILTATDTSLYDAIKETIDTLKPYAGRKENERTRILVRVQQILLNSQETVSDTTTFYGKTFFSHLQKKWLNEINKLLEERDASTFPKLEIDPKPCFISTDDDGNGVISFIVSNVGDSTAQSYVVKADINGRTYTINHDSELPAGDISGEKIVSSDFSNEDYINVLFHLSAKYREKNLPTVESEASYERENEQCLTDEIDIPWSISGIPTENIFKGREDKLNKLVSHYLSKDRYQTYILYGLTRTGKSSILDYLCKRIDGKSLPENPSIRIKSFKWDLSIIPYINAKSEAFWTILIEQNIYDKLPDDIADRVDEIFSDKINGQSDCNLHVLKNQVDFVKFIDALNNCGIMPLITIDEFSSITPMLKNGLIDASFLKTLRELSLSGKACFVYAGTYEIKNLPRQKEYGLEGQMNNTVSMSINEIEEKYANELIDACPNLFFDDKAKAYIRALSGCIPYWIQWICLGCGKYAVEHKRLHLGYNEVDYVVKILTEEATPTKKDTITPLDVTSFQNNQVDPQNEDEQKLISCLSLLIRESTQIERGVSIDELNRLWDKFNVPQVKRDFMSKALQNLVERKIVKQFTDETREVYRLSVDLFRRWWYVHHRDLNLILSL